MSKDKKTKTTTIADDVETADKQPSKPKRTRKTPAPRQFFSESFTIKFD